MLPLSVYLKDRIELQTRERISLKGKIAEMSQKRKLEEELKLLRERQRILGLGDPNESLSRHITDLEQIKLLVQAEQLAEKFRAVKPPMESFIPRVLNTQLENARSRSLSRFPVIPQVIITKLRPGLDRIFIDVGKDEYSAPIPLMPATVLELASRAKEAAPDCEFHLIFMPSWKKEPQKDPVLLARIPGTDEWFLIGEWGGDLDVIKEFWVSEE